ncbi:hypothetical protein DPMN_154580 [Dreissena polymorpha]|uniref:C1q domain-containing protein n=1 Tax=Dreissena polymorpha TaxID=45954 RepID=A0A9D4FMA2_DREPO|nr:hypothetical protein DPMN_154580 [Dreissena polymorpha]
MTRDLCGCSLAKNAVFIGIKAYINTNGIYGVSNGAYLHLVRGDTVQLVECSPSNWFESWSSFSGVLIKSD